MEAVDHNHFESHSSPTNRAQKSLDKENKAHTSIHLSAGFPGLPAHESPALDSNIIANRQPTTRHCTRNYPSIEPVPADTANVSRPYSCTICGSQRSYQNHYDWKKHEKEHEAKYICRLGSSQDALRMVNEKTESHGSCKFTCKRRDHMVTHLNRHHEIHKVAQARILADQWRRTTGKKFWSCGFCIRLFTGFTERLKHIGSEHYEQNQTYDEWDTTKLIRGLLLQPEVQRAWESILATYPPNHFEELVWDARAIKETQYILEMGPSPTQSAESLAMAAYKAGKLKTQPPQSASALSVTAALGDVVETDFGNPDVMIHPPVSRHANVEHMLSQCASNDTSVPNASSASWAASTGYVFDELYYEANPSEGQAHMPDGTPGSEYNNLGLTLAFESSKASKSPLSYATQTFNYLSQDHESPGADDNLVI